MIKRFLYIFIIFSLYNCDTENGSDCLKTSGTLITKEYLLEDFDKVIFHEGIELEIKQGAENSIKITYGNNIINDITTNISEDRLVIDNITSCNLIRDFEPAKVVLTVDDISEIRNASQFKVFSNDALRFESLTIISENFLEDQVNVGDFDLIIENQSLNIITNNVSNFIIKGSTTNLYINFASGTGKFEGENLVAQNVNIFHRGINNMIINPVQQLTGEIRGAGNVISVNRPTIVDVKEFYTGRLIFKD